MSSNNSRQIGLWIITALVVGNMIGSGIFLLPSSLAAFGGISIFGWIASGLGAFMVAIVFSRLSKLVPKTGGPYIYPKEGFGEFIGFFSGFGYWMSVLLTNASIAMAFTGYLFVFTPSFAESKFMAVVIALGAVWFLTWLNSLGVKSGGKMQVVTTLLKIIPLVLVTVAGYFFFNIDHFKPLNLSGMSDIKAVGATVALTLFAFLGIESGTVPAGNVKDPEKTIPLGTMMGTIFTILIYLLSTFSIMGVIPPEELKGSTAPFADAAEIIWGESGKYLVGFGAMISIFGALNGWILIQGQIPFAMAKDDLMPPIFKKKSKKDFPLYGLVISSVIVSMIVLANSSKGFVELFTLLILVGTFLTLISYLFSSLSEVLILIRTKPDNWKVRSIRAFIVSIPAFVFSLWAVYGSGQQIVFYGFLILMLGLPVYVYSKMRKNKVYLRS
jgi:basic amino acid/polyamine antiporter, APA family